MAVQAFLVVVLVMSVVFAWRASGRHPAPAALAAAIATMLGLVLLRNPVLALVGLVASVYLIYGASRRQ